VLAEKVNPIEIWRDDAVEYVHAMWEDVVLESWQEEFLSALANGNTEKNRISIRSGHGVGKTAALCFAKLWFLQTRPNGGVLVVANSQSQLKDNNWAEAKRWVNKMPKIWADQFDVQATYIKNNAMGSFATARTATKDNPEAIQGFRGEETLIMCDEASGIPDITFESGMGSLSQPGTKLVLTGNPTRGTGYFYDSHNTLRDIFYCMHVPSYTVERSTGHIEDVKKKYGEGSNAWRVRVEGEFPQEEDDAVIPRYLIDDAFKREAEGYDAPIIWGVDVAEGVGRDRTALVKRKGNVLLDKKLKPVQAWLTKNPMEVAGMIYDEYQRLPKLERPFSINVDTVGIGAPLFYRLKELGLPAKKVNVAESPSSKERFVRMKDELWWEAREWFEGLDVSLDPDDEMQRELAVELSIPLYQISSAGKIRVESKQELKKRGVNSPDLAEALIMTFIRSSIKKNKHIELPRLAIV